MKKLLSAILVFVLFLTLVGCSHATPPMIAPTETLSPAPTEVPVSTPTSTPTPRPIPTPIPTPIPLPTLSPEYVNAYAKALATEDDIEVPEEYRPCEECYDARMVDGHVIFSTNTCNVFIDGEKTDTMIYECVWLEGLEELPKDSESLEKAFAGRQTLSPAEIMFACHYLFEVDKPDDCGVNKFQLYRHGDEIVVVYSYFEWIGEDVALSELYIDDQPAEEFYS